MQKFFDDIPPEVYIITREEVLLPDFLPDELLHRNSELQTIASAIKPLLRKQDGDHLLIHGKSGTGKTSCVKSILKQLTEHSMAVLPVYVNCWENPTKAAIYARIIETMQLPVPRRGLGADELFDKVLQYVKHYSKPVLLVLDELDGLEQQELLYVIARANEKSGILFGIIGITNNPAFLSKLDPRTRGSLHFSELAFKEYSQDQLFEILKERAVIGLAPASFDERLLHKISASVDEGSARVALERLRKVAKHAERSGKMKISLQDLADCEDESFGPKIRPGAALTDFELLVVAKLREGEKNTDELYSSMKYERSKRQFMNYLSQLEKKGIILMSEQVSQKEEGKFCSKVCKLKQNRFSN